jgi:hypothetical protein
MAYTIIGKVVQYIISTFEFSQFVSSLYVHLYMMFKHGIGLKSCMKEGLGIYSAK